ncbi:MAG: hypothetical protein ABWX67_10970 [Allosphingosinicella sp.]
MTVLAAEAASAQVVGHHLGLPMVPTRCKTEQRGNVNVENLLVFYNKTISFGLGSVTLKSKIVGNRVEVIYGDEPGTAIFDIGSLIPYRATDIRLYHGTLENKPVMYWQEVVENVPGRGGVVEYRGRAMFSLCMGLINRLGGNPN